MTPPDWFLQVLGGAAVAALLVLLLPLTLALLARLRSRRAPAAQKVSSTNEHEQRRLTHVHSVLRPGLLHAAFNRGSVSRGDDAEDHWGLLMFEQDVPISTLLSRRIHMVLASIQGGRATWLIQLHEPLEAPVRATGMAPALAGRVRITDVAVVAQQWAAPRLLCEDFPVSRIGTGTLYARYLAQQDPDEVWQAQQSNPSPREESTYTSYAYDPDTVPPEKRTMIRYAPQR